jgi:hypothetical protein
LLKRGKNEDCGLAKAGLCLANDVGTQDGLGDTLSLDCGVDLLDDRLKRVRARESVKIGASAGPSFSTASVCQSPCKLYPAHMNPFLVRKVDPPLTIHPQLLSPFQPQPPNPRAFSM